MMYKVNRGEGGVGQVNLAGEDMDKGTGKGQFHEVNEIDRVGVGFNTYIEPTCKYSVSAREFKIQTNWITMLLALFMDDEIVLHTHFLLSRQWYS